MTHPLGGYSLTNLLPTTLVRETPVSRKHGLVLNIGLSKGLYRDAKNKSQPGGEWTVQGHCSEGYRGSDGLGWPTTRMESQVGEHIGGDCCQ
jgi:hypothetical protein